MTPVLVEAVKELKTELEQLKSSKETEIGQLKAQVGALTTLVETLLTQQKGTTAGNSDLASK